MLVLRFFINVLLSHRFSGKTPVEEIVATMKEYVEYVSHHHAPEPFKLTTCPAPAKSSI